MKAAVKWCLRQLCSARDTLCSLTAASPLPRWLCWMGWICASGYTLAVVSLSLGPYPPTLTAPLWFLAVGVLLAKFWRWCGSLQLSADEAGAGPSAWKVGGAIAILYLTLIIVTGAFESPDTQWQWRQAVSGGFDDWHPVIHTGCIWLIVQIWENYTFAVAIQSMLFAALCGWCYATLRHYAYRQWVVFGVTAFLAFSPASLILMRVLWKDTAFALAAMALCVMLTHLWHTHGRWLWHPLHLAGFLAALVLTSFLRHNGIFLTIPICLLVPLFFSGIRGYALSAAVALVGMGLMLGYVSFRQSLEANGTLATSRPDQRFTEAVGLPMSMLGESFVSHPEKTPSPVCDLLEKMAPHDFWVKHWRGDFNSVKFALPSSSGEILCREVTPKAFFGMLADTVARNPKSALKALLHVTSLAWDPIPQNSFAGLPMTGRLLNNELNFLLRLATKAPLGWFFAAPGFYVLLWVIAGTFGVVRHGFRALPTVVPFLSYAAGTALLLTGWDYRFFFALGLCIAPMLVLLLSGREVADKTQIK